MEITLTVVVWILAKEQSLQL